MVCWAFFLTSHNFFACLASVLTPREILLGAARYLESAPDDVWIGYRVSEAIRRGGLHAVTAVPNACAEPALAALLMHVGASTLEEWASRPGVSTAIAVAVLHEAAVNSALHRSHLSLLAARQHLAELKPYRWALAGVVQNPYPIPRNTVEFVNTPQTTRAPSGHPAWRVIGPRVAFRELHICRARVFTIGRSQEQHRGSVGVALFDGDRLVGSSTRPHLYLHENYRGRGLGAELIAERLIAHPELWLQPDRAVPRIQVTPSGERAMRVAYQHLLDRRAIVLV